MITDTEKLNELSMIIYDEQHNMITNPDLSKGWLEDGMEQNKFGAWRMTQIYHPFTKEELEKNKLEQEKAALSEKRRNFTMEEMVAFFMREQLNTMNIPDQTSLRMLDYYPSFEEIIGQKVKKGFKFTFKNKLYKTLQPDCIIQAHYQPGVGTESLYTLIDFEHTGAVYDPIVYDGNMEIFNGKYYIQDGVLYLCIRDSNQPLYHKLKDLVGNYVEIHSENGNAANPDSQQQTNEYPDFKQPTGGHDAYKKGDKVTFENKKYISTIDNNVWSPKAYPAGWKEITKQEAEQIVGKK